MLSYAIIEVDEGLTVVQLKPGSTPYETAYRHRGVVVDAGPFESYDEACDAMQALEDEGD